MKCKMCEEETDEFNYANDVCDKCYKMVEWMYWNVEVKDHE